LFTNAREDLNAIGGTPDFLQREEYPTGDGWQFALQFSTAWAALDLGDGAEAYGFLHDDLSSPWLTQATERAKSPAAPPDVPLRGAGAESRRATRFGRVSLPNSRRHRLSRV
jgi:hypothetical protein